MCYLMLLVTLIHICACLNEGKFLVLKFRRSLQQLILTVMQRTALITTDRERLRLGSKKAISYHTNIIHVNVVIRSRKGRS